MLRNLAQASLKWKVGSASSGVPTMSTIYGRNKSSSVGGKRRSTQLKEMITSPNLEFIMEAHSGLSARIVEETGWNNHVEGYGHFTSY